VSSYNVDYKKYAHYWCTLRDLKLTIEGGLDWSDGVDFTRALERVNGCED
jgi:hypothetical protein